MTRAIFKVQLPLATSGAPDAPALIYTADRRNRATAPVTAEMRRALGGEPKGFFWATLIDGQWVIDWTVPAPWQEW